ncbi:MAG: tyrosine-type recombinase/integrase [Anaerolineales bacterium]|jgi:site-specific recombinase XerD
MPELRAGSADKKERGDRQVPLQAAEFLESALKSERTRENYRWALVALQEFAAQTGYGGAGPSRPLAPAGIRDDLLVSFLDWLRSKRRYSPATLALYVAAVKRYLGWLYARGRLPPAFRLDQAREKLKEETRGGALRYAPRHPDPSLASILAFYDGRPLPSARNPASKRERLVILRNRAAVHTLYSSAGRASEVAQLDCAGVDKGYATTVEVRGKGGKLRTLILTQEAQYAIREYLAERERQGEDLGGRTGRMARTGSAPLFVSHGRGKRACISRTTLWRIVAEAARALGLKPGSGPHAFRHFRAQSLRDEGMDLGLLQAMLGHSSIETTRRIYAPQTSVSQLVDALSTYGISAREAARRARKVIPGEATGTAAPPSRSKTKKGSS